MNSSLSLSLFWDFFGILKSLRSRGIRFPGRDNESLAPIFTPPRSVSAPEMDASLAQQIQHEIPVVSFTAEQTKEAFDVARNSIELLSTVLSSSPQQDVLKVPSLTAHVICMLRSGLVMNILSPRL